MRESSFSVWGSQKYSKNAAGVFVFRVSFFSPSSVSFSITLPKQKNSALGVARFI